MPTDDDYGDVRAKSSKRLQQGSVEGEGEAGGR